MNLLKPEMGSGFVDTNAMKPSEIHFFIPINRKKPLLSVLFFLIIILAGCGSEAVQPAAALAPESLTCPECELVDVASVINANTLDTSIGKIQMYGVYVLAQPSECASLAEERLRSLAGTSVRVEAGATDTIRRSDDHYYLYTPDGRSIEEILMREGLALAWTQDCQHVGWFLFRSGHAKENESGCLWKGWNAFQRGEPSEFRVPGLTYPDPE